MSIQMWRRLDEAEKAIEQQRHDIRTLFEKIERLQRPQPEAKPAKVRRVG